LNGKDQQDKNGNSQAKSERTNDAFILLVQKASRGNRDALIELCKTTAKGTLFRTTRILGNQTDAEDVTQEVMLSVCAHIHELREPKAFYVWLNRIIINECNRYLMKRSKHGVLLNIEDYQENIGESDEDLIPQEYAIRESDRKIVMGIIDNLPGQQRKAILLHYYDGLTLTESAKVMNVSQPRVSRCLKFAQEKIKKELAKQAKGSEDVARMMAMVPLGPLLTQVLNQEAAGFTGATNWMHDIINNAASLADGAVAATATAGAAAVAVTATTGASAGSAGSAGASGAAAAAAFNPAVVVAVIAAAAIITGGALVISNANTDIPEPVTEAAYDYAISFTNEEDGAPVNVNPTKAVAQVHSNEYGDMTSTYWWITAKGDDGILYEGYGNVVEDELIHMKETGETGEYVIRFNMLDSFGDYWVLSREFTII